MENTDFVVNEQFSSADPPDQAAIQQAITLWLTKELNKPHQ